MIPTLIEAKRKLLTAETRCELHSILIEECNEKLVEFPVELSYPFYRKHRGIGQSELYLRKTVADMLLSVNENAKTLGYSVILYDGYRDNEVQDNLFLFYLAQYTAPRMGLGRLFEDALTVP